MWGRDAMTDGVEESRAQNERRRGRFCFQYFSEFVCKDSWLLIYTATKDLWWIYSEITSTNKPLKYFVHS